MLSKKILDQKIIHIIKNIRNEFPELLKYIDEMPVNICQNAKHGVHAMELVEYHNSLAALYNGYAKKNEGIHQIQNKQISLFYHNILWLSKIHLFTIFKILLYFPFL